MIVKIPKMIFNRGRFMTRTYSREGSPHNEFHVGSHDMKLTPQQLQALASKVLAHWQKANLVRPKADEKIVLEKMVSLLKAEVQKEADLERDVHAMLDQLERSHGGQFERHKMYPMLKSKMAKERKVIL